MKHLLTILSIGTIIATVISCTGKQEPLEKIISASKIEIIGPNADGATIFGDIKIFMVQNEEDKEKWSICALVPISNNLQFVGIESISASDLDLLDANYSEINDCYGLDIQNKSYAISLFGSPSGTRKNIVFEPTYESISYKDYQTIADIINKTEHLVLYLRLGDDSHSYSSNPDDEIEYETGEENVIGYENENGDESGTECEESASYNNDWDTLLDEYESYVDNYISLLKKANAGDMSAFTEYMTFLEKSESLSNKLSDAKCDMTVEQINRYMKILTKMTNAATSSLE